MKNIQSAWALDAKNPWEIEANPEQNRSLTVFFQKTVELQKRIGAKGFAIVSINRSMDGASPLKIIISDSGFAQDKRAQSILENADQLLVTHVKRSPYPVYWSANPKEPDFIDPPKPARELYLENAPINGLAFPVHLGNMQSGLAIFFAPSIVVTREMQVDIHRKTYTVLRELFKLEMQSKNNAILINAREIECLQYAGNGMTSDEISDLLNLSVHTINAYLSSATSKLDSVNRVQAIANALRLGLIN